MTIHHTYRIRLRAKNGKVKTSHKQTFTFDRQTAQEFLDKIGDGRPLHDGHLILRAILIDALKRPNWKTITIRYCKCS